jgi:hypothetical protein
MDITKENPEIVLMKETIRRLEQSNRDVEYLLNRIPLKHHSEVARLGQLVENQLRLASIFPKSQLPPRVMIFFENARDRASALRQRYYEAINTGNLRMVDN